MTTSQLQDNQRRGMRMKSSASSVYRTSAAAGSLGLMLGFLLGVAVLAVRLDADLGHLGRVIFRHPNLCVAMAVVLMVGGAALIKQASRHDPPWSPKTPGRRFRTAVLYTRPDCSLCDEAALTLQTYRPFLPPIREVDIDGDRALRDKFGNCIPVLELDGRVRFRGHINERLLQRLIEGTPVSHT